MMLKVLSKQFVMPWPTASLSVPERLLVSTGSNPQVIVMILPDGTSPGMLEDLCLQAVTADPGTGPAMNCVGKYFECLESQAIPPPNNMSKARVHTYLASRPEPDLRLGEAAQEGYLPWNDPTFNQVRQFIEMLAGVSS